MRYNFDRIFLLLSLIYDPRSIQLVKENIESGTSESKVYALELLDVFIDKHLKTILFPLLDDIPAAEEVSIYQAYFPRETLSSTEVLLHILNREYNSINRWTKACAIYSLALTPHIHVTYELVAHIFNPDQLLRETAAWAIYRLDHALYESSGKRLKSSVKKDLDSTLVQPLVLPQESEMTGMMFQQILFLKKTPLLSHLPSQVLSDLADSIETLYFQPGALIIKAGQKTDIPLYIISKGKALYMTQELSHQTVLGEYDLAGEKLILDSDTSPCDIVAQDDVFVYAIEKEILCRIISHYPETGNRYALIASGLAPVENPIEEEPIYINA
jgi:hypothetical protein